VSKEGWLNNVLRWTVLPVFLIDWWIWAKVQKSNKRRIGRRIVSRYGTLAAAGDAVAMANLGILYKDVDEVAAAAWFRKAAEGGDVGGMINLAQMYEEGRGGLKNDANQALTWYRSAANIGSHLAQRRVQCAEVPDETA
jgi:TPR repeat protein